MKLAHETIMPGHLAVKMTIQKVLSEFSGLVFPVI